jgi:hypothetical protein
MYFYPDFENALLLMVRLVLVAGLIFMFLIRQIWEWNGKQAQQWEEAQKRKIYQIN